MSQQTEAELQRWRPLVLILSRRRLRWLWLLRSSCFPVFLTYRILVTTHFVRESSTKEALRALSSTGGFSLLTYTSNRPSGRIFVSF